MSDNFILIISAVFPPEPTVSANISYDIATKLANSHKVKVLTPRPSRPYGVIYSKVEKSNLNFEQVVLNSYIYPKSSFIGRLYESFSFGWHVRKYIIKNHAHIKSIYMNSWPLLSQYFIACCAKKYQIPLVTHIQDIYPESYESKVSEPMKIMMKPLRTLDKYILNHSADIICISNQMSAYINKKRDIKNCKLHVVRNWQTLSQSVTKVSKNEEFTFMYLGNIAESANVDLLIRAYASVSIPKSKLLIVGNGSMRDACMALALQYDSCIEFLEVEQSRVADVQAQADVLLLALKKGIGNTAMPSKFSAYTYSGKPIIASVDIECELACEINKYQLGFVCAADDQFQLSKLLVQIATLDKKQLELKGQASKAYFDRYLSKDANIQTLIDIIESNCL